MQATHILIDSAGIYLLSHPVTREDGRIESAYACVAFSDFQTGERAYKVRPQPRIFARGGIFAVRENTTLLPV